MWTCALVYIRVLFTLVFWACENGSLISSLTMSTLLQFWKQPALLGMINIIVVIGASRQFARWDVVLIDINLYIMQLC